MKSLLHINCKNMHVRVTDSFWIKKKITTQKIARVNSLPQSKKRLKSIFANLRKLHFSFKRKNFSMKRCWYIGMINSLDMKIKLFPIN